MLETAGEKRCLQCRWSCFSLLVCLQRRASGNVAPGNGTFLILYPFPEPFRRREGCRMSLTEVCALLTVVISLLALLVTVAKAAFDAGWKISHEKSDKNKED